MGNAFTALADDAEAGFWNPAGFVQWQGVKIAGSRKVSDRESYAFDPKCVAYSYRDTGFFWGNKIALRVESGTPDFTYYSLARKLTPYLAMVGYEWELVRIRIAEYPCHYFAKGLMLGRRNHLLDATARKAPLDAQMLLDRTFGKRYLKERKSLPDRSGVPSEVVDDLVVEDMRLVQPLDPARRIPDRFLNL